MISTLNETNLRACSKRRVYLSSHYFNEEKEENWEIFYSFVMNKKWAKGTRNYSTKIKGTFVANPPPIYVVPRIRGGSYHAIELEGVDRNYVQYCEISKGYGMQDVSSFTLGPVKGEGLCIVNAAFSKSICVAHIEGGGIFNPRRLGFWQRSKPERKIEAIDATTIRVDGVRHNTFIWLKENEELWYPQWSLWRRAIALCSEGNFHWTDDLGQTIAYRNNKGSPNKYIDFVRWKKDCYIRPGYELIAKTSVFSFLSKLYHAGIPLGLVHPKGMKLEAEKPVTVESITELYNSEEEMACMPYVVAGLLLNVPID